MHLHLKSYYHLVTWIGRHEEVLVLKVDLCTLNASSPKVLLFFSNMDRDACGGPRFLVTVGMFTQVFTQSVTIL